MIRKLLSVLFCASLPFLVFPQDRGAVIANTEVKPTGKTYAIIVGVSKYKEVTPLNFAHRDAEAFADFLKSKAGGSVDPNNIKVFTNENATKANIFSELYDLKPILQPGDLLYFFFAGHGDIEKDLSEGNDALLLLNKSLSREYLKGDDYIDLDKLSGYIRNMSKKNVTVVFIADACHSGAMLSGGKDGRERTLESLKESWANEIKMLSCQTNETSEENKKWGGGRGIFSYILEDGLKGMADANGDSIVSVREIKRYLENEVAKQTGDAQNPDVKGDLTRALAKVDPPTLAELKQQRQSNLPEMVAMNSQRGTDDLLAKASPEIKKAYEKFNDALGKNELIHPDNSSAYAFYKLIMNADSLYELKKVIKRNLVSALQDGAMIFIQRQLNGQKDIENYNEEVLNQELGRIQNGVDQLKVAIEILGDDHYLTPSYKARMLYLEAYVLYFKMTTYTREYTTANLKKCTDKLEEAVKLEDNASYALYLLGDVYSYSGKTEESKNYYERYLKLNPRDGFVFVNLAYLAHRQGQYDRADSLIEVAMKVGSNQMNELVSNVAGFYYNYKVYDKAKKYYKQALQIDSNFSSAYLNLGVIARIEKEYDLAAGYYKKILALNPTYAWAYNNLANIYSLQNDTKKALEYYAQAIKYDSSYHVAICNLAKQYETLKDYPNALKAYYQSKKIEPYYDDNYFGIGNVYYKMSNYDSAELYYYYANLLDSTKATYWYSMGNVSKMKKEEDWALYYYTKAYTKDSSYSEAYNQVGHIYYNKSDYPKAILYYSWAVNYDTTEAAYWNNLGKAYQYSDSTDLAMKIYRNKVLKLDSTYTSAFVQIGNIHYDRKRYDSAEVYYRRAIKIDTNYTTALYNLGLVYDVKMKYEEAINCYKKTLMADSTYSSGAVAISKDYKLLGNNEEAIKYAELALQLTKEYDKDSYLSLASMYYAQKNYAKTREFANVILEKDSNAVDALFKIGVCAIDESKNEEAIKIFKRIVSIDTLNSFAFLDLGLAYTNNGDYTNGLRYYQHSMRLDSSNVYIWQQLGLLYRDKLKQLDVALPYFHKALEIDSTNLFYSADYLAYNYMLMKDSLNAEKYFKLATDLTPEGTSAYYNLACLYSLQKRNNDALKHFELSLKKGYRDFAHINEDTDLDNIRELKEFKDLIRKYEK